MGMNKNSHENNCLTMNGLSNQYIILVARSHRMHSQLKNRKKPWDVILNKDFLEIMITGKLKIAKIKTRFIFAYLRNWENLYILVVY
jgi:hypothetical protein